MKIFFLIVLMLAAYAGALWWRKKISKDHAEFKARMDLAADPAHAKRLLQESLRKRGK